MLGIPHQAHTNELGARRTAFAAPTTLFQSFVGQCVQLRRSRNEDGVFLFKPCAFAIVETHSLPRSAWAVRLYPTQQQTPNRTPNNRRLSRDLEGNLRFTAVGGTTAHVPQPISKWNAEPVAL
jgi:hypothetical protein